MSLALNLHWLMFVICSISIDSYPAERLGPMSLNVRDVAVLGVDELLSLEGNDTSRTITAWRGGLERQLATLDVTSSVSSSESLMIPGPGQWWYATRGDQSNGSSVIFLTGDHDRIIGKRVVTVPFRAFDWIPLFGETPSGLLLSAPRAGRIRVDEMTQEGVRRLGEFSGHVTVGPFLRTAQRLADGRIALVSHEVSDSGRTLGLKLFGSGETEEVDLEECDLNSPLTSALDSSGRLVVVGVSRAGKVTLARIDPSEVRSIQCRALSSDRANVPQVVTAGERLIATWIRESDRRVQASEVVEGSAEPIVIDIGTTVENARLNPVTRAEGEWLTTVWTDEADDVVMRRLPVALSAYGLALEARRAVCGTDHPLQNPR